MKKTIGLLVCLWLCGCGRQEVPAPPAQTSSPNTAAETAVAALAQVPETYAAAVGPSSRWRAGVNYQTVVPAQTADAPADKVEVLEFFWYGCTHCAHFEPFLAAWQDKKAAYIEFKKVPVIWSMQHMVHAQLFYTLEALKRQDLHVAVFKELQEAGNPLFSTDHKQAEQMQADFAKRHGIDEQTFRKTFRSSEVEAKVLQAEQLVRGYRANSVPLMTIGGKYVSDLEASGHSPEGLLDIVDSLAAYERQQKNK